MKLKLNKSFIFSSIIIMISSLVFSCGKRSKAPPIGNNMSFPGSMIALGTTDFLLLNTSANGDYSDGSIQRYTVDSSGNHTFISAMSVPAHGTEIAVSSDSKLVALSFDGSYSNTQVQFYNYSNKNSPYILPINLSLPSTGGKQAVKRIGFFKRTADNSYYFYGSILTFPNDDGSNGNIPSRVFVAKIDSSFSSVQLLFILSYGLNDTNSLSPNSTSINSAVTSNNAQYTFGYGAPTYVGGGNDLFIAFPTGSIGGFNNGVNSYPVLPDALTYLSGTSNSTTCNGVACKILPDFRTISLAAVDMADIVAGKSVNNSTYFVPLLWNQNGMGYRSTTNGTLITYPNNTNNSDLNSFSYQYGFWSSYWANTSNVGSGATSCYATTGTTSANQYQVLGDNSVFVAKSGLNGNNDNSNGGKTGNGTEVLALTGFDNLRSNINVIKGLRTASGDSDFNKISAYQIIDFYNAAKTSLNTSTTWTSTVGPLTPFMFSRTSNVSNFDNTGAGIANISVVKFASSNTCRPYWARNTVTSGSLGRDTAWLISSPVTMTSSSGGYATYQNLTIDPTQPSVFNFSAGSGAQSCTDVLPIADNPKVFCVNYLYSTISRYKVSSSANSDPVIFTEY